MSDREAMYAGNFDYDDNTATGNESTSGSLLPSINYGTMPCSKEEFYSRLGTADDNITRDNEFLIHALQTDDSMAGISEKQVDYPSRNEQETSSLVDTRVESKNEDSVENQTLKSTHSEMEDTKKELVLDKQLKRSDLTWQLGLRVPNKHLKKLTPAILLPATLILTDQIGGKWKMEFVENTSGKFLTKKSWLRYQESQGLKEGDTIKIERIIILKERVQKIENIDWEESVKNNLVDIEYTITKILAEDQVHNED